MPRSILRLGEDKDDAHADPDRRGAMGVIANRILLRTDLRQHSARYRDRTAGYNARYSRYARW